MGADFMTQHQQESPYSTHSGSTSSLTRGKSIPIIYNQLDELMKQNDSQRQLLNDLVNMFEVPKSNEKAHQDLVVSLFQIQNVLNNVFKKKPNM